MKERTFFVSHDFCLFVLLITDMRDMVTVNQLVRMDGYMHGCIDFDLSRPRNIYLKISFLIFVLFFVVVVDRDPLPNMPPSPNFDRCGLQQQSQRSNTIEDVDYDLNYDLLSLNYFLCSAVTLNKVA